jgi:antitoxin ParD1/3/4
MTFTVTPEIEHLVNEQLASGLYASTSEVLREALRLLQERNELRREIALGAEQLKQGDYKEYASVDELIDDIQTRGQARLAAKQNGQS